MIPSVDMLAQQGDVRAMIAAAVPSVTKIYFHRPLAAVKNLPYAVASVSYAAAPGGLRTTEVQVTWTVTVVSQRANDDLHVVGHGVLEALVAQVESRKTWAGNGYNVQVTDGEPVIEIDGFDGFYATQVKFVYQYDRGVR